MTDWEDYAKRQHMQVTDLSTWLIELLREKNSRTITDFGCGDGMLLRSVANSGIKPHFQLIGVDHSRLRLDRLAQNLPSATLVQADVSKQLQLAPQSVDLAISTQVIEHVPDQKAMLNEMARLTKPGGRLFLTTVFKRWYAWYFHRCEGRWVLDPTHLREYSANDQLLPDVEAAGFRVLKERKIQLAYPLVDPLLKWMGRPLLRLGWLHKIKLPIPGYYTWEIVAERKS
ncbi:MAG: class I SAM-dependent methyltransferase [Bdellovibrionales bacterium]